MCLVVDFLRAVVKVFETHFIDFIQNDLQGLAVATEVVESSYTLKSHQLHDIIKMVSNQVIDEIIENVDCPVMLIAAVTSTVPDSSALSAFIGMYDDVEYDANVAADSTPVVETFADFNGCSSDCVVAAATPDLVVAANYNDDDDDNDNDNNAAAIMRPQQMGNKRKSQNKKVVETAKPVSTRSSASKINKKDKINSCENNRRNTNGKQELKKKRLEILKDGGTVSDSQTAHKQVKYEAPSSSSNLETAASIPILKSPFRLCFQPFSHSSRTSARINESFDVLKLDAVDEFSSYLTSSVRAEGLQTVLDKSKTVINLFFLRLSGLSQTIAEEFKKALNCTAQEPLDVTCEAFKSISTVLYFLPRYAPKNSLYINAILDSFTTVHFSNFCTTSMEALEQLHFFTNSKKRHIEDISDFADTRCITKCEETATIVMAVLKYCLHLEM